MALTEIPSELSSTPSIVDNGNATALTISSSENVTFNAKATIQTATNEEDGLLIKQSDGTDVGALRINNGSFLLKGKNASQPVQIQSHDGNEDIEIDPDGFIKFETAGSETMRISGSNVGIGESSPAATLQITTATNTPLLLKSTHSGGGYAEFQTGASGAVIGYMGSSGALVSGGAVADFGIRSQANLTFATGGSAERMRIRSNGTSAFSTDGNYAANKHYSFRDAVGIDNPNSSSYSTSTAAVLCAGKMSSGRSINATGTINASGADYAEYMYKADGCGTIAKGDVVGVDINGKLTDVFADAISFVIKSTDPSYVGGDVWADEEPPTKDEEDTAEWDSWYARTEAKRATVDRIAFSGQVPVNITGSFNVGDYVYPQADGSSIKAVAKSSPTFDEYKLCVGKIWATEKDGRPFVAVKIG